VKLELKDVRKWFGTTIALEEISLSIARGEFVALLGPSGSGKTTLLRAIAGLERIDRGEIVIDGKSMRDVSARARGIGFVFQHYALFRHMTVARNVAFGLRVRPRGSRPSDAKIRQTVEQLLELLGIGGLGGRYPHQLSGGQRQRVALARALAIEPSLLLLDEPFGALDAQVRASLRIWLRDLHDRMGLTSLFVTHDQTEALEMADRVVILNGGRIEQAGTPEYLWAEPSNAFVHEFLGDSIRFNCFVVEGIAHFPDLPGVNVPAPSLSGPAVALMRPHEVGLRPGPGVARIECWRAHGPWRRAWVVVGQRRFEVRMPEHEAIVPNGETAILDLSRARFYSTE